MKMDAAQFASLVAGRQAMVYSIAWNYLHDTALAEEIAQEAFLELHRCLPRIESEAHAANFLRRVAAHRAIDEGRRRRWQSRAGLEDVAEPVAEPAAGDPMLDRALHRLVDGLPGRSRMIVILRFQEDLEPAEIAQILEIPLGTVKSNLHRSLKVLRKRLEHPDRPLSSRDRNQNLRSRDRKGVVGVNP